MKTETEYSALQNEPLGSILAKALELSGRRDDFFIQNDPFAGLSAEYPVLAFAALNHAAKHNENPEWAWRTFLNAEARKNDKPRFSALIAERISRYPNLTVAEFILPASYWTLKTSEQLAAVFPQTFDRILSKLISVLRLHPTTGGSTIVRGNKDTDWATEALNSPAGKIAQALFNDPRKHGLKAGEGFPTEWVAYVDDLLRLSGDPRRHALVIFAHNLNWFYTIDPCWTEANMLSVLDNNNEQDRNAIWSGFFWGATVPNRKLYMRLKTNLLSVAEQPSLLRHKFGNVLSGMILAGWGTANEETGERFISSTELHDVLLNTDDEFRSQILWQAEEWLEAKEDEVREKWETRILELIRDVWPRQKSIKTPTMSARLCGLAFSNAKSFPEIAEKVLPLLTTIDRHNLILHDLIQPENKIVDLYPRQTLAILHAVLPDDVASWPYGIENIIHRIGETDDGLILDERLLELKRKWNSR